MIKFFRSIPILLILFFLAGKVYAQFPYDESFRNATAPGINFGGVPSAFLTAAGASAAGGQPIDPQGNGYLRLTSNQNNQKGYIYNDAAFPSFHGLKINVEYYVYDGNGADGISFFLFDATANPFVVGGFGGSLGYAPIQINPLTDTISPGVSKGYIAIGLDEYGNFSNPIEGRQGGIAGLRPNSVTIRGKGDGDALVPTNYSYLTSVRSSDFGFELVPSGLAVRVPDSTNVNYRRASVDLKPSPGGYDVTVRITVGGPTPTIYTIVNNYHYAQTAPPLLRYGIASSTGALRNFHEIRNVSIKVYDPAVLVPATANPDIVTACLKNTTSVNVIANDATLNTGGSIDINMLDLDPLTDGVQKTFTLAGKGTFTASTSGIVTFVPINNSLTGSVSINYTIKDNYGQLSAPAAITINDAPAPPSGTNAGTDQLIHVSAPGVTTSLASTLLTGQAGLWSQVSGPSTATITSVASNSSTVTGLAYGTYTFRWAVTEGVSCEGIDDVNVVVNAIPIANDDNIATSVSTDIQVSVLDNDTDANGNNTIDKTKVVVKNNPIFGTILVDPVSGKINYRPLQGFTGSDSFVYTIKDNYGVESNTAVVTISVSAKPVGTDDAIATISNVPVATNVKLNDASQTGTTVVKLTDPAHGSVTVNTTGPIIYIPVADYHGFDVFTYVLRNTSALDSDPITVNITVRPVGLNDIGSTPINTPVVLSVKDNDSGRTGSTVLKKTDPLHGTALVNADGTVTYTPVTDYNGNDSFTYSLRDLNGLESDPITVSLTIRPAGSNDLASTNVNLPVIIPVKDNDVSKVGTTVLKKTDPANGTAVVNTDATVTYTPNPAFQGTDTFTYTLRTTDGTESNPITVTIVVSPKLTALPDAAITKLNIPVTIDVKVNDPDGPGSTVVKLTNPSHGTAVLNPDGTFLYTPAIDYYGPDSFTYRLTNSGGLASEPITVTIGVRPAGTNDVYVTVMNTALIQGVKDNDVSKTGTTVIKQTNPGHGTAVVNADGTVTYTPVTGYMGADTYTYTLRNIDALESDLITVTISIKPVGIDDASSTLMNTLVVVPVKDNDPGRTGTSVIKKTDPLHGTASVNSDGTVNYTPVADYNGRDSFTYTLRTSDGVESDVITAVISIRPVGVNDNAVTPVGVPVIVRVKDNDPGRTGTTIIKKTDPLHGTVVINPDGTVTYSPVAGYRGPDTFIYTLRNSDGMESDPITVTLETRNLPIANPDGIPVITGVPVVIKVTDNDTGQDCAVDKTTVVITSPPLHGTVAVNSITGEVTYTPFPGYSGIDNFNYTVKDCKGLESRPSTVTITVSSPKIGIAKKLLDVKPALNGTYDVRYLFTIVNYSPFILKNISLKDDLLSVFNGAVATVLKVTHQGTLKVNTNFNGSSDIDMLVPSASILSPLGEEQVELTLNIRLVSREGIFENSAIVEGFSDQGIRVTDQSTDGLRPDPVTIGDVTPLEKTPVELRINPLFIPEGFSPNNDGINDYFVIQNTLDKPVVLEIYNRWANMVYKSNAYQNDWNGKTNQGIRIGDEVPAGSYWYIVIIDDKKYNGFITINR